MRSMKKIKWEKPFIKIIFKIADTKGQNFKTNPDGNSGSYKS